MGPTLGRASLLLLDGGDHLRTRKLMLPPFHSEAVKRYAAVMAEIAAAEIDGWPTQTPFAVRPAMQRITLEVILRAVFGIDDAERLQRLRVVLAALMDQNPAYLWFEWSRVDLGPRSPYGRSCACATALTRSCSTRSPAAAATPPPTTASTSSRCWCAPA
jgi:cytochrome P450